MDYQQDNSNTKRGILTAHYQAMKKETIKDKAVLTADLSAAPTTHLMFLHLHIARTTSQ
jgi:hypothetical protein